jgi:aspartate racemase
MNPPSHQDGQVIGIVGGMGPDAGIYLAHQITELTRAGVDESDMDVILASCPRGITDRTEFVLGHTDENPAHSINAVIDLLARAGVSLFGMACNTAHARPILDVIKRHLEDRHPEMRLVSMVESVKSELIDLGPGGRVAVLGTLGTFASDIYGKALDDSDWSVRYLDGQSEKERLHQLIYAPSWGLKATGPALSERAAEELHRVVTEAAKLADVVLLACTELSMAAGRQRFGNATVIDSSYALAKRLVSIGRAPVTDDV